MNTDTLVPKLTKHFQKCTKVSETSDIYRCERIYKDTPRSVYFFKASPNLPSPEEMSRIHQDIVGPSYFLAKDASRWNHYVVFVSDDNCRHNSEFLDRRKSIESNKDYARKLVVFDSELDRFIDHSITTADAGELAHTVVTVWTEKLAMAGLSQIQTDSPRAKLIRMIRKGENTPTAPATKPYEDQQQKPQVVHLIEQFTLKRFGTRAITGTYEFGRVNLICGPNGSGKTSLLEAIEHFFCGATYRSEGHAEAFEAEVVFAGRPNPVKFQTHKSDYYQERDQRWYGRTINRGNRLWEGFSRFNFLNTDAAVDFSTDNDQQDLAKALSKIALGPEAAFTWNRIGEFEQDLDKELGPINSTIKSLQKSISAALARETVLKSASPQIEASFTVAHQILAELGWVLPAKITMPPDAQWFIQFQPLRDLVSAIQGFDIIGSIDDLSRMIAAKEKDLQQLQELQNTTKSEHSQQINLRANVANKQVLLSLLQRLGQFLDVGLPGLIAEENRLRTELANVSKHLIATGDLDILEEAASNVDCLSKTANDFEVKAGEQLATLRDNAQSLERERAAISRQLALVDTITSQIRTLGHEYAVQAPHARECPMCRTRMEMAELLQRIQGVGNQSLQTEQLEKISKDLSKIQPLIRKLESAALTIKQIRKQADGQQKLSVAEQIQNCRKQYETKQTLNTALEQAQSQRKSREDAGFDLAELSELRARFDSIPEWKTLSSMNPNHIRELSETLKKDVSSIQQQEQKAQDAIAKTAKNLQLLLDAHGAPNEETLRQALQGAIRTLKATRAAFDALPVPVGQQFAGNLSSLAELCSKAIKVLDDLSTQVQAVIGRNKELELLKTQLTQERTQLSDTTVERDRLQKALDALRDIKKNHSLETGLDSFLLNNLTSIQQIFSKIHVPNELRLSNLDGCKLERIGFEQPIKLNQISTGQRAAFMLSVFLTLNLSLRNGPPQVLIDDPVAHIDDLNSLSFLDYLADIAEFGKRQIFFATANDKLANLFQKKMEFLGKDFHTIEAPLRR